MTAPLHEQTASTTGLRHRLLLISLAILVLDQWTKLWIERNLARGEHLSVISGFFDLVHVTNTGVAFGLFPTGGRGWGTLGLIALGTAALSIIGLYFWKTPEHERGLLFALVLILGGALGNLTDRLLFRGVTDFLDFFVGTHHFPTFNVADSAISVGIALLAWETIRPRRSVEAEEGRPAALAPSEREVSTS